MTAVATVRILGIDGSPTGGGRTEASVLAVGDAAVRAGAHFRLISLAGQDPQGAVDRALEAADTVNAFILGSPMYRASFAFPLKLLLDRIPRGFGGEAKAPITGRAVVIVGTGASWHHFLGLDGLRSVLTGFFAAHVLPPGLYAPREGFGEDGELLQPFADLAHDQGRALVDLAGALPGLPTLTALRPQA